MQKDTSFDRRTIRVEPSIFAGDFGRLAEEAKRIEQSGGDAIHIDIMDGHFVPNLTLGPRAVAAIRSATNLFLDVHIMAYNPLNYIETFIGAGADQITFHVEATEDIEDCVNMLKKCNKKVGMALCPDTSLSLIVNHLTVCDMVLLMTVHPGFGGQAFIHESLETIAELRNVCNRLGITKGGYTLGDGESKEDYPPFDIQVDGGIDDQTAKQCVDAGANVLVAGTYLFQDDMSSKIQTLKHL